MTLAIVQEVVARCSNPLETQESIARSYAKLIRFGAFVSEEEIIDANKAIKARYPSKSGLARVKKMAWAFFSEMREAAK